MVVLEKDIERALVRMVKRHGGECLKWVCPGWSGVPDRLLLLPGGHIVFVELKSPQGGKRSKLQAWWAERLTALGFRFVWVHTREELLALEAYVLEVVRGENL